MGVWAACLLGIVALLGVPSPSDAQVGLRSGPLINNPRMHGMGARNAVGRGVFSRWPQEEDRSHKNHRNNSSNIERSLAAIFRGVAYGISPPTTTTTTTTSTTTTSTLPPPTPPHGSKGHAVHPHQRPSAWPDLRDFLMTLDEQEGHMDNFPDLYGDIIGDLEVEEAEDEPDGSWAGSLGVAWAVHVYCSASMFTVVGLLSVVLLSRMRSAGRFLPLGHHLALHLLMLIASVSRCLHLFHDPYGTEDKLPEAVAGVVEDIGWPCLTAAIAVVVMALVQAWRCPPHPPPNHAPITLAIITVFHFLVAVFTHILAIQFPKHAGPLRAASRTATAAWGGVVGLGCCVGVCRVVQALQNAPSLMTVAVGRAVPEWVTQHTCASLLYAARLALVTTLVQVMLAGLHLYGLLGSLVTTRLPPPRPWHWLAFQSASSGLEVLAWVLLALISLPSVRDSQRKRRGDTSRWQDLKKETWRSCCCCKPCPITSNSGRPAHEGTTPCKVVQAREVRPYPSTAPSCNASPYKQALLRSAASDAHLLWSHARARDAPTSSCSSRPSSIVLNNEDLSRINKTPNHYTTPSAPPHVPLKSYEKQGAAPDKSSGQPGEEEPTAYDQHLYYNVPVAPKKDVPAKPSLVAKRSAERPSERLLQGQLSVDLHGADSDEDHPRSDLASLTDYSSTEPASPAAVGDHDWSRNTTTTCSSVSAANSFDLRMFEDSDGTYYQLPYIQTPPPPPPPPLNLRHHPHHYPSRSLAGSAAELQDGRRVRPVPDPRGEAQRSHPDLVTHAGSSPYKWSSAPQWSPKGLQRGYCASMGTVTGIGPGARLCTTGDPPSNIKQGKAAYPEQAAHGAAVTFSSAGVVEQQRGVDHHILGNLCESNTSMWHQAQSHPRQNRRQRTSGPGEGAGLRAAPSHSAQDIDGDNRIPTPRPPDAAPPHSVDGTTQTEVPPSPQPTWPTTPSPPPPRHPPPVLIPSEDSSLEGEDPGVINSREILPTAARHQESQVGDLHHDQECPGDPKQEWAHPVHHQHTQAQDNSVEDGHQDAHHDARHHHKARAGDHALHQVRSVDLRHQEVQCDDMSGQIYPGDRMQSHPVGTQTRGENHGEQEHTDVNVGEDAPHETRPPDPRPHQPRPGDRTRPHHYNGGR